MSTLVVASAVSVAGCSDATAPSHEDGGTVDALADATLVGGDDAARGMGDGGVARSLGAFIGEPMERFPTMPGALPYYSGEVGGTPAVVLWYTGLGVPFPRASFDAVVAAGSTPLVTLQPGGSTPTPNPYPLTAIARGDFDASDLIPWADAAAAAGRPFFLRFAHEMNSATTYPWGTAAGNPNHNTPTDYVNAWRHVHDVFAARHVTNALWVFCPNSGSATLIAQDYPGDAYVDWLCFDAYNRGALGATGQWHTMLETLEPTYTAVAALSPGKPIMVGETSSVEEGDKALWITQGFLQDIPARLPRIRLVVWFDAIHTDQKGMTFDWRIASTSTSLAAYRSVVASPDWQGAAP